MHYSTDKKQQPDAARSWWLWCRGSSCIKLVFFGHRFDTANHDTSLWEETLVAGSNLQNLSYQARDWVRFRIRINTFCMTSPSITNNQLKSLEWFVKSCTQVSLLQADLTPRGEELERILAMKDQLLLMERQLSDSHEWPLGCATT